MKTLKQYVGIAAIFLVVFLVAYQEASADTAVTKQNDTITTKAQELCPIMGGKINKKYYADHKGKRVYFCCSGCDSKFKQNPDAHIARMEKEGIVLDKALKPQTSCPVSGEKIKKSIYTDYEGKRVYFCCSGCVGKFKAEPEKYLKKLKDKGEEPVGIPK
jgi:YHS domain-containing protein